MWSLYSILGLIYNILLQLVFFKQALTYVAEKIIALLFFPLELKLIGHFDCVE